MHFDSLFYLLSFWKIFGTKITLALYSKKIALSLPMAFPIFGRVRHKEEILNIRDNILQGNLRNKAFEKDFKKQKRPVVVDCGVNVGITVRWWFHLNPRAAVYGVDMMQEAHDFTKETLNGPAKDRYIPITAVLAERTGQLFDIHFHDPLFGGNNIDNTSVAACRRHIGSKTLDDCLAPYGLETIHLLKVDIEGSGLKMFLASHKTLLKTRNILLENHNREERNESLRFLLKRGFHVRDEHNRHIWFERCPKKHIEESDSRLNGHDAVHDSRRG